MTAVTTGVRCAAGEWTLVSAGKANVLVTLRNIGVLYLRTASAEPTDTPSPEATDTDPEFSYVTVSNLKPFSASFTDTSTDIWLYNPASEGHLDVEVIAE